MPQSGAAEALDAWTMVRSYPAKSINTQKFSQAFQQNQSTAQSRDNARWEAMGPKNIAGRALDLAFHPTDSNIIFLGAASGGLWKTVTRGVGEDAWVRIPTGFPVLAVSCIAISPTHPQVLYIGTGEMYNSKETMPSTIDRLTRGTYGIGILKSTDGGATWETSLDWAYQEMRGIQNIAINPLNDNVIYAATSIGLMKSSDAGKNWDTIHDIPMAVDVEINLVDTNIVYVSYGSLFHSYSGIYRTKDAGITFEKLRIGIPTTYSGKAMLAIDPNNPSVIYASIANAFESLGLYRSSNEGNSWLSVNKEDVAAFQGWYAHDVAVNPLNPSEIVYVGIDAWKSKNLGFTLTQQTFWFNSQLGKIPVGKPDGPPDYVHADIHRAYYHPLMPNTVFLATDGGVFVSKDGGTTYQSRNGGLQTTQFYANFANSTTDPNFAIGGMQDNSTAIYTGEDAWTKVLSGDGMSAAIDPIDDNFVYGSAQFLNIFRSTERGVNFQDIAPGAIQPAFNAPFEIVPSNPKILYAGAQVLYKSTDKGSTWAATNADFIDNGNALSTIAIAPNNPDRLLVSTAPTNDNQPKVLSSHDGGQTWKTMSGLPNRLATDITFHPENEAIAFIVFGGFNSFHLYQTINGGENWFPIDNNLPDIPYNSIVIDPLEPKNIYIGNDLGVYASEDAGGTWGPFMEGLPEVVLAMHLSIAPANRQLRLATHGNGVFQTPLIGNLVSSLDKELIPIIALGQNFPNPADQLTTIPFSLKEPSELSLKIYDITGRLIKTVIDSELLSGEQQKEWDVSHLPAGTYVYVIEGLTLKSRQFFKQSKTLIVAKRGG